MKSLTRSARDGYWYSTSEATVIWQRALHLDIARVDDDDEDDPDSYWHP